MIDKGSTEYQTAYRRTRAQLKTETKENQAAEAAGYADYDRRDFAASNKERRGIKGKVVQETIFECRNCGEYIDGGTHRFERRGIRLYFPTRIDNEIPAPCPHCNENPFHRNTAVAPGTRQDVWAGGYWDTDLGPKVKGATYVKGKGVYIQDRSHAEHVAKLNGRTIRPEYR